jgi:AsmA protein
MARRARRIALWVGAGVAALGLILVAVVIALVFFVDANIYKPRIERTVTAQLGRPFRLSGDLHWKLGRTLAVESEGGEVGNAPGFGKEPFASWRRIRFGLALRPLLRKVVQVDSLEIEGLTMSLRRNAMGEGNWSFPALGQSAAQQTSDTRVSLAALVLRDADLRYSAEGGGEAAVWRMAGLDLAVDLSASDASPRQFKAVTMSGTAFGAPLQEAGVPIRIDADLLLVDTKSGVELPAFAASVGDAQLTGNVRTSFVDALVAEGAFALKAPSLRTLLASLRTQLPATQDAAVFGAVDVATQFKFSGNAFSAEQLQVHLDDTRMEGTLQALTFTPLALRFDLSADQMNVDRYLEPKDAKSEPFELPLATLKKLDAKGVVRIREATVTGARATGVRIDVQ